MWSYTHIRVCLHTEHGCVSLLRSAWRIQIFTIHVSHVRMDTWHKGSEGSHYQISEPVARTRRSCDAEKSTLPEPFPSYRNATCLYMRTYICICTYVHVYTQSMDACLFCDVYDVYVSILFMYYTYGHVGQRQWRITLPNIWTGSTKTTLVRCREINVAWAFPIIPQCCLCMCIDAPALTCMSTYGV